MSHVTRVIQRQCERCLTVSCMHGVCPLCGARMSPVPEPSVTGVLLVPNAEHMSLLDGGPCGCRPPVVDALECSASLHHRWADTTLPHVMDNAPKCACGKAIMWRSGPPSRALVLAWDGEVVPAGMDVAGRAWEGTTEAEDRALQSYHLWWCRMVDAQNLAAECERAGLGRIVLVGADGREVQP